MYNQNDFLERTLFIINNNRIKSNSLKNHILKYGLNEESLSQVLGYLSELESNLDSMYKYISDFQLLNNNMMQNLEEASIKEDNFNNEIFRLKRVLNKANDEIHSLRSQNNYLKNIEKESKRKFLLNKNEEEKNSIESNKKVNNFRNYLPLNSFRKSSISSQNNTNSISDNYGRLTYYLDENKKYIINNNTNNEFQKKIKVNGDITNNYNNNKNKTNKKNQIINQKSKSSKKINKEFKNNNTKKKNINPNQLNNINNTFQNRDNENNNSSAMAPNNNDIKDIINQEKFQEDQSKRISISNSLNLNSNNQSQNSIGKIITHNNSITLENNNKNIYPFLKPNYNNNYKPYSSYNFNNRNNANAIMYSKRMQNYFQDQKLKSRLSEINKEHPKERQERINNIIRIINNDNNKLNELKIIFGNSIEGQIYNGDLNDDFLNKIENFLYYMENSDSIIPFSKRFQIYNNSSKKKKLSETNFKSDRLIRKKLTDRQYNKTYIKRWNTTKNFHNNKKRIKF